MPARPRELLLHDLGLVEYPDGLALQKAFALARKGGMAADVLLLVEHPPLLTMGRAAKPEHLLSSRDALEKMGIQVYETDRGGDITYHGPGQVVGYPVVDLSPDRCDVRRYVGDLEETMIQCAADFGVKAGRIDGWTGVWVGEKGRDARKIGALGVHISRWVTTHGFAFNATTNLDHFNLIVPCGIREAGVTSLQREIGRVPLLGDVKRSLTRHLAERLGARVVNGRIDHRTISVSVLRRGREGWEALLLRRHPHRGNFWQPVTGTIERRESPQACAKRELMEETGIPGEVFPLHYVHSFLFGEPRPDRPPRIFQETGFFTIVSGDPRVVLDSREHCEFKWVPVEQALSWVPHAGLREALRRAAARARARAGG